MHTASAMYPPLPIVYLAFANAKDAHLDLLKAESRDVLGALTPLKESGRIEIQREESTERTELFKDLVASGDRLVVFHYAGHANGARLQLEDGAQGAQGLARLLGQLRSLKLVFLNGCATEGHVKRLLECGVPAVIATSVKIGDKKAKDFSVAFYTALAKDKSIAEAFDAGRAFLEGMAAAGDDITFSASRAADLSVLEDAPAIAWNLFTRPDAADDLAQWRLPDARDSWRVQLTDAGGPVRDMSGAPLAIDYLQRFRTLQTLSCGRCKTVSAAANESTAVAAACPVCGAADVTRGTTSTTLGDEQLPFAVTEEQARARVLAHVASGPNARPSPPANLRLRRLFVPVWVFDVDTRTTFEAERGTVRALGEVGARPEWEPVRGDFDFRLDGYSVAAGSGAHGQDAAPREWSWDLARALPLQQLDSGTAYALLDRPVQAAFNDVADAVRTAVDDEIRARAGGLLDPRNPSSDTRYRSLRFRSVMLPCWYADLGESNAEVVIVVNGQTGAVRAVPLPVASTDSLDPEPILGVPMPNLGLNDPTRSPGGASIAVSVFSGASIGLMIGMLLALSVSPTVGIFISALGTGLGVLLGLNDSHFSKAKGIRIGALGLSLLVGVATGLYVRTHALLSPSLEAQRDEYIKLGYSKAETLRLLEGRIVGSVSVGTAESPKGAPASGAKSLKEQKEEWLALGFNEAATLRMLEIVITKTPAGPASQAGVAGAPSENRLAAERTAAPAFNYVGSFAFSAHADATTCGLLRLDDAQEARMTASDIAENSRGVEGWEEFANEVQKRLLEEPDRKALLLLGFDAACGEGGQQSGRPPRPTTAQCKSKEFAASDALSPLAGRIAREISESGRNIAMTVLGNFLCSVKPQ